VKIGEYYSIPNGIRVREIEDLKPGKGECTVRVKASGVCSTDVKMAKRGHNLLDLYGLPFIGGHEFSGEVAEIGPGTKMVKPGDNVVVSWINPCLECFYCKKGLTQFCLNIKDTLIQPAGFSEMVLIPSYHIETRLFPFSKKTPFETAAMTEPVACALNGIQIADITIGDTVVILGAGFMGMLLLQLALLRGASEVVVIDSVEKRLQKAHELGATKSINFKKEKAVEAVMDYTKGYGADVVIEATGNIEGYRQAVLYGRIGSTVLYFGGLPKNLSLDIDPNIIHYRQIAVKGSYSYTIKTFQGALNLLENGKIETEKLISHRYTLDQLKDAIEKSSQTDSLKVMINME